ncbi:hypothetical protein AX774_g5474 [Zancudomyces culisetae]|uniref:Uncharacterized protein n=1 Tax=Zancudomyces culisetae TaxID=1213189 RepID=A0A1R1PJD9_ZANCU|nr:hypothetical protein AX774_g5474 [Zancudomyces culisetae]|eukprot:OMH81076.1 hypothetical protein AX774_g5474 [Zancudomyces culisetae]
MGTLTGIIRFGIANTQSFVVSTMKFTSFTMCVLTFSSYLGFYTSNNVTDLVDGHHPTPPDHWFSCSHWSYYIITVALVPQRII